MQVFLGLARGHNDCFPRFGKVVSLKKQIGFLRFGTGAPLEKNNGFPHSGKRYLWKNTSFPRWTKGCLQKNMILHRFAKSPPLKNIRSARGLPQKNTGFHGAWKLKGRKLPFKKPREQPNGEKPL